MTKSFFRVFLMIVMVAGLSCGPATQKKSPETKPDTQPPTEPVPKEEAAKEVIPYERPTVHVKPQQLDEMEVSTDKMFVSKKHTYLRVQLPSDKQASGLFGYQYFKIIDWASPINNRRVIATQARLEDFPNRKNVELTPESNIYYLYLRVDGTEPLPDAFTLEVRTHSSTGSNGVVQPGASQRLNITHSKHKPSKELKDTFYTALSFWFAKWGYNEKISDFSNFASARLLKATKHKPTEERVRWRGGVSELASIMDFYTSQSNVKESMAYYRGLGKTFKKERASEKISDIQGIDRQQRDYKALLKPLGSPTPVFDSIAKYLPADAITVTFSSLGEFARLTDYLDDKLGLIARVIEQAPGPFHLKKRYGEQLAVEFSGLAKLFGDLAAGNTALVLNDPYLREGTGVSLVFENKDTTLLASALEKHVKKTGERNGGLESKIIKIAGHNATLHTSKNGVVRRYQIQLPEITIISNSLGALTQLLEVYKGKRTSLLQSPDYGYARAIVPYKAAEESAFVFLGDSLMESLTSPTAKILESRRMRAKAELNNVNYAALLYGWMEGKPAQTQKELLKSKWLDKKDLVHFDGQKIRWTKESGATSKWGSANNLVPVIDLKIKKVTKSEKTAYEMFRNRYNRYWAGRLDPTLIRLKYDPKNNAVDSRIHVLPISPNGKFADEYRQIRRMAGEAKISGGQDVSGLSISLALGKDAALKKEASRSMRIIGGSEFDVGILGDWIKGGIFDTNDLWNLIAASGEFGLRTSAQESGISENELIAQLVQKLPLWFMLDVGNPIAFVGALAAVRGHIVEASSGMVSWEADTPMGETEVTKITIHGGDDFGEVPIFYSIVNGTFVAAMQKHVLQKLIASILKGDLPKLTKDTTLGSQFATDLAIGKAGWVKNLLKMVLDYGAYKTHISSSTGYEILAKGLGAHQLDREAFSKISLIYLGYEPESPHSGAFSVTQDGLIAHDIYNTQFEPTLPGSERPLSQLQEDVGSLKRASASVATEERGSEFEFIGKGSLEFIQ